MGEYDNQIIWNNKHILVNNSSIFYRDWFEKGIIHVGDLYENGNFITLNSLKNRFNLNTNFVQYYGVCKAIPRTWKTVINNTAPNRPYNLASNKYFILNASHKPSKIFYWQYVKTRCKQPEKVKQKWKDVFQDLEEQHFKKIFIMPYTCTIETKLRNFQLKFIHRILPNRNLLFKMKKVNSRNCTFCKNVEDNLEHMFWDCRVVSQFYNTVEEYLKSKFGHSFNINKKTIFFGNFDLNKNILCNHIYILLKFYIYYYCFALSQKKNPSFRAFQNKVNLTEETERYIANKNNTLENHIRKWEIFFQ